MGIYLVREADAGGRFAGRCQQTVLPLAEAHRLPIDSEAALGQVASVERALRLLAEAGDGTVVSFASRPALRGHRAAAPRRRPGATALRPGLVHQGAR